MNEYELSNCKGFILEAVKNISKKEFVQLCNNLQIEFNNYYNTDDYSFRPECISEGGIIFNNFNNRNSYKSMRMYFTDKNYVAKIKSLYGWINDNIKDEWMNDENILINENEYIKTYMKCNNAPKWYKDELKIFKKCFENIGLFTIKLRKY